MYIILIFNLYLILYFTNKRNTKNCSSHFRSVSLCNVLYKIVAKIVVNRMSGILDGCIDEAQGAFISGQQISGNVLIAYEVLHTLKMEKWGRKGEFALKRDMSKTYDRVERDFLVSMMSQFGFHFNLVALVMRCICSVSYTVGVNDGISNRFLPSVDFVKVTPSVPTSFLSALKVFLRSLMKLRWMVL